MDFKLKISPSKLASIAACPCYYQEDTGVKSEAAETGDLLHRAVETEDLSILLEEEQKEAAKQCLMYIGHLAPNPAPPTGVIHGSLTDYDQVFKEIWLESDIGKRGRADGLIFPAADRELAILYDTKFGKMPVEHAETNPQGQDYAYRVFKKYPHIKRVQVHFIMPAQRDVTMHEFTREADFVALRTRIIGIHERYNDPFKLPTPNLDKACNYCGLKAKCPALAGSVVQVARKMAVLPLPEDFAPNAPRTDEERGMAQDLADLMIKWGTELKSQNTQAVLNGAEADGYRVQSRKGNISVINPLGFATELCDKYQLSLEEILEKAGSVSFTDAVALLKSYNPDLDAGEIRGQIERDMGHLIKRGQQISFLARERKGKGKEIKANALAEKEAAQKLLKEVEQSQPNGE